MKFQKILLCATLALGTCVADGTANLKYNFKCLDDNRGICKHLKKELSIAVDSISKIVDFEMPVKFEAFVDDLSKYRVNISKEVVAAALDKEFAPLNTADTNIASPYSNSKALLNNLSVEDDNQFYLVLNNFKSNDIYLDTLPEDLNSSIAMEIFEELKLINALGFPYVGSSNGPTSAEELIYNYFLAKRKDQEKIDASAVAATENCQNLIDNDKTNTIVHWKDTLLCKESVTSKVRRAVKKIVKCRVKDEKKEEEKKIDDEIKRIIAIGDIHGDYEHLISILQYSNLIDEENNWIGTDTILVQVGDLADRGFDTYKVYDTMLNLREQAKEKGGYVYILLGNHDLIEIEGDHYYIPTNDYKSFGGLEGLEEAFGPTGRYGSFIRQEMNVTMVVGDTIFAHAGVLPKYLDEGVDKLNEYVREILLDTPSAEDLYQLTLQNVTHPIYADELFEMIDRKGPMWLRDYARNSESQMCSVLEEALKLSNTKRMVVGHTVQTYGKIRTKCNNKLFLIDIGISRCIGGGYYGYLEMLLDKKEIWARYLN